MLFRSDNLRREAERRGIDPQRLVFAQRMPPDLHLARLRLADLYLDTRPCNGGASVSDALRAGLPVLTLIGTSFVGRVAASLLHAVDLPELVTHTAKQYEDLAVALACDPARLGRLRGRLADRRASSLLFDTRR